MARRKLPRHRHIVDWTEYILRIFISRRRTFIDKVTDKSFFYYCCSAQWDKASPLSYQYTDDVTILEKWAALAADSIRPGETIVDYGPGSTGKVLPITKALPKGCHYLAVDMDRPFLKETIRQVAETNSGITAAGIQTSFQNFPEILGLITGPKTIISLGSNLLNHAEPVEQMRPIVDKMASEDRIYLSIDCHGMEDEVKVTDTYKCPEFMKFIEGTLERIDGYKASQWDLTSGLSMAPTRRYSFTLTAKVDVKIRREEYPKGTSIEFFPCYKSSEPAVNAIAYELGMWIVEERCLPDSKMYHFLLEKF